jgi:hypothetical protein
MEELNAVISQFRAAKVDFESTSTAAPRTALRIRRTPRKYAPMRNTRWR